MQILVTGATGLIGRHLVAARLARGDAVLALSRSAERAARTLGTAEGLEIVEGDPTEAGPWQTRVDGCDAVVHLAGAGIADHRWTTSYKRLIASSRLDSTTRVVEAIETAERRPAVLVQGSAIGYYGDTGATPTDETAGPGDGELADLCMRWEAAAAPARGLGVRLAVVRTGIVLDADDGALPTIARPFRFFVGGPIGRGRFHMSWIHRADIVNLLGLVLDDASIDGPINGTAPEPVTNRVFSTALGRALRRPSWLPVPYPAVRLAVGEFARFLVQSQNVVPARATAAGYEFAHPSVAGALEDLL